MCVWEQDREWASLINIFQDIQFCFCYLAVIAVLGVIMACSMVLGREPCVPGRMKPDSGRPD